jgi:DMSO/TMAO reductase YedYZ molybdopterin-dependent catalytic subunit
MKRKTVTRIILSMVLLCSLLFMAIPAMPVLADDPSQTITITKYSTTTADPTKIVAQWSVNITSMEVALPVLGDGVTHYWTQGPTLDPSDYWNQYETLNLKDKGALKGTDVKDLCELVGGAYSGGEIEILGSDGWGDRYPYANVYNPQPEQGPMTVCWWKDGVYSGADWPDGMLLAFFTSVTNGDEPGKFVFGDQDMHDCLPQAIWHYTDVTVNQVEYHMPSANGLYSKWVSQINIYPEPQVQWQLELKGADTYIMSQNEFENGATCSQGGHGISYTDGSGNVYTGMPLWLLCGWVDDGVEHQHGTGAFNDALAAAGYSVNVSAPNGFSYTFASATVARNNDIIVANTMNGVPLPDDKYPLALVGSALTSEEQNVSKIAKIELLDLPTIQTWNLELDGAISYTMTQAEFEDGVNCTTNNHAANFTDSSGTWKGLPLWLLCGWVDDDVQHQHGDGAFNDALASAGYTVNVSASDGFSYAFQSSVVARNNDIIVANTLNGVPLSKTGSKPPYPLKLVGSALTSGKQRIGAIVKIQLLNFPITQYSLTVNAVGSGSVAKVPDQATYNSGSSVQLTANPATGWSFAGWSGNLTGTTNPATVTMDANKTITATFTQNWNLQLTGLTGHTMPNTEFEALAAAYPVSCIVTSKDGLTQYTYSGVALWRLIAVVDGGEAGSFNDALAATGYSVNVSASDYTKTFGIADIAMNDGKIIANKVNSNPLTSNEWPLRYVWTGTSGGSMVSKIAEIKLINLPTLTITASAGANGTIDPSGGVSVVYSTDQTFTITPNAGCQVADVLVDGASVGAVGSYPFTNIIANHTISASFVKMMSSFSVTSMSVTYTPRQPRRDDTIIAGGTFRLPDGINFDPAADAVSLNIDGTSIVIPAGTFKKQPGREMVFSHDNHFNRGSFFRGFHATVRQDNAVIMMTLNVTRGTWDIHVNNINACDINNYDGVDVTLTIGPVVGTKHIDMTIDSLSYQNR